MKTELHQQHIANEALSEIEITPEMIEAGCRALRLFDTGDRSWDIVYAVYEGMEIARRARH